MVREFSNQPDAGLLALLKKIETACLTLVFLVALATLVLWLVPALRPIAPHLWSKMVANSAAALIVAATGLAFGSHRSEARRSRWIVGICAGALVAFGVLTLTEFAAGVSLGIDQILPVISGLAHFPGRPAPQTCLGLIFIGASMLLVDKTDGPWSRIADASVLLSIALVLILCGGYLYGALELIGLDSSTITAPQTVACLALVVFVLAVRRAASGGAGRVMLSMGIGSQATRLLLPGVIVVPLASFALVASMINSGKVQPAFARAYVAVGLVVILLFVVNWLTSRINELENELRKMSLSDELTALHNRRGFLLLGEQAMREARRSRTSLNVLYFDLDGLKSTNDRYGHEAGSHLITAMAELLRNSFRESDIVARIGGDEFVVLLYGGDADHALVRLYDAAAAANRSTKMPYKLTFSAGVADFDPESEESIIDLLHRADGRMYEHKRGKQVSRRVE